ncbi:invasion associated locus B family protein [Paracoccus sp. (in: a-proteobacteria)]|uniref:invasion associated locus B family protein n=1 Tax=Paracoccus sp. TaxID=267 RepID=UPI00321F7A60
MANRTSAAMIAALLALTAGTGSAVAQTATPAAPAQPAAEAPAAEAPAAEAEAPKPAAPVSEADAKVGQPYARSTHGDWTLRCMKTDSGKDPCELYQLLKDKNDSPVIEVSVLPMTGNVQAVVTFIAPLETDLQAGLGIKIDDGKDARYPFMLCAPVGCISRVGMAEAEMAPLKRGKTATISVLPFGASKEQLVQLPLSLSGFTAGMAALVEANKDLTPAAPAAGEAKKP